MRFLIKPRGITLPFLIKSRGMRQNAFIHHRGISLRVSPQSPHHPDAFFCAKNTAIKSSFTGVPPICCT